MCVGKCVWENVCGKMCVGKCVWVNGSEQSDESKRNCLVVSFHVNG
jgi:hypothetical protein